MTDSPKNLTVIGHIRRLVDRATDRALERLLGKIPLSAAAVSWYMTISMRCPTWYISDFIYPQDFKGIPLKKQRQVMACLELMAFKPTLQWGKILLMECKRVARSPETKSIYRKEARPDRHPPDVRGIFVSPPLSETKKES